jgi:hypothetical protein
MGMPTAWRKSYAELKKFISQHPEIEIGEKVVRIPEGPRKRFYQLFDMVGAVLLQERFPTMLREARRLGRSYSAAEARALNLFGGERVTKTADLKKFLESPEESLVQELFDATFDLLKGIVSVRAYRREASKKLWAAFEKRYRSGYEKWVELSLAELLLPDMAFRVRLPTLTYQQKMIQSFPFKRPVPVPERTKEIVFGREALPPFLVPDFIVHSKRLDGYVAMGSEAVDAVWAASDPCKRRKWLQLESISARRRRIGLKPNISVCVGLSPEDVSLMADSRSVSRPDLIIECTEQEDQFEGDLEKAKLQHKVLKPPLGSFLLSSRPLPEQAQGEMGNGLRVIAVGFDRSKLAPVIESLKR